MCARKRPGKGDTPADNQEQAVYSPGDSAKAWFIVLNNPRKFIVRWYREHGQEPPEYIMGMPQEHIPIELTKILVPKGQETRIGVGVNVEEGIKENTEHSHIAYYKESGCRFREIQALFFKQAHIEIQRGTKSDARDYLEKKGKWENDPKGDTLKVPPLYFGLPLGDNRKRRGTDQMEELDSLIPQWVEAGLSPTAVRSNVAAMGLAYAKYSQNAELVAQALIEQRAKTSGRLDEEGEMMYVVWHFGSGGVGKTHSLRDLTRRRSVCYLIDPSMRRNPWDKYSFQPMVVWDDFRDTQLPYDAMLSLLNREGKGTVTVDARYYPKTLAHCRMDITSINGPEKQWPLARQKREEQGQKEPLYQLTRRIDLIVYHFEDDRWPKSDSRHWCAVALPGGRRYKHSEQLERLAQDYLDNPYNGPKQQARMALAVDRAMGATITEKQRPKFEGTSDDVEHQIRLAMWKKFEGDPYRKEKLDFLGLTPEETGEEAPRETVYVVDNSTVPTATPSPAAEPARQGSLSVTSGDYQGALPSPAADTQGWLHADGTMMAPVMASTLTAEAMLYPPPPPDDDPVPLDVYGDMTPYGPADDDFSMFF